MCSILLSTQLHANTDLDSEMSHALGGVVMAGGGITAIVDHYYPEYADNRGMIGFGISSLATLIYQAIEISKYGDTRGQIIDAASHIAGSALGAFITDKYILSPVIKESPGGGKSVGIKVTHSF